MTTTFPSKLDLTKPVRTRGGQSVRILCTDAPGRQPVIGLFEDGTPRAFNLDGAFRYYSNERSMYDLVNAPVIVTVCVARRACGEFTSQVLKSHWTKDYCFKQWGIENCTFIDVEVDD